MGKARADCKAASAALRAPLIERLPVQMGTGTAGHAHAGRLPLIDNSGPGGTLRVRAVFDTKTGTHFPASSPAPHGPGA